MDIFAMVLQKTMQQNQQQIKKKQQQITLRDYIISYNFRKNIKMQKFFTWIKQQRGIIDPSLYWQLNDGLNNGFQKNLDERIQNAKRMVRGLISDDKIFAIIERLFQELKGFFIEHLTSNRKNLELIKNIFNVHKPEGASSIAYAPMGVRNNKSTAKGKQSLSLQKNDSIKKQVQKPIKQVPKLKEVQTIVNKKKSRQKQKQVINAQVKKQDQQPQSTQRTNAATKQQLGFCFGNFINQLNQQQQGKQYQKKQSKKKIKTEGCQSQIRNSSQKIEQKRSQKIKFEKQKQSQKKIQFGFQQENPQQYRQDIKNIKNKKGFQDVVDAFDDYGMNSFKKNTCQQQQNRHQKISRKSSLKKKAGEQKRSQSQQPKMKQSVKSSDRISKQSIVQQIEIDKIIAENKRRRKGSQASLFDEASSILSTEQIKLFNHENRKQKRKQKQIQRQKQRQRLKQKQKEKQRQRLNQRQKQTQQVPQISISKPKQNIKTLKEQSPRRQKFDSTRKTNEKSGSKFQSTYKDKQAKSKKKQLRRQHTLNTKNVLSLGRAAQLQISQLRMSRIIDNSDESDRNEDFDDPFKVLEFFGL